MGEYGWSSNAISDTCPGISSPLARMARMVPTAIRLLVQMMPSGGTGIDKRAEAERKMASTSGGL